MNSLPRLYAIADASYGDPIEQSRLLFAAGVRLLQVRNKNADSREFLRQVENILAIAPEQSSVIVNDRVDIALIAGAAGVHLGQNDLPAAAAREILGVSRIIGVSTHNMEQALNAESLPVDYVAVGPVFPTSTKRNPAPVVGIQMLRRICGSVRKPVIAIGGITLDRAHDVYDAGVASVAVINDLLTASDIHARATDWINLT